MNCISSISLCTFLICHSTVVFGRLFLCTYDKYLVNIKLECPNDDDKIHILHAWNIASAQIYKCGNDLKAFTETRYGFHKEILHKVLKNCLHQRNCNVNYIPDLYRPNRNTSVMHGIGIEYRCIPAEKFIPISSSTPKINRLSEIYLIDNIDESLGQGSCNCEVEYGGSSVVTLVHFPTAGVYLKVKTWKGDKPVEKVYQSDFYNETIKSNSDRQVFTVINNGMKRTDEMLLLDVRILATDKHSYFSLQCFGPPQAPVSASVAPKHQSTTMETPSTDAPYPVKYVITSAVVTALCILAIGTSALIIYRRLASVRKRTPGSKNADLTSPGAARNMQTSAYIDCSGSLNHSYAEIGSLSEYRHYVVPDDTSQTSLKVRVRYKTLVEEERCNSEYTQDKAGEASNAVLSKQRKSRRMQHGPSNENNSGGNNQRGIEDVSNKMPDTERFFRDVKTKPEQCLMSINETADNEHDNKVSICLANSGEQSNKASLENSTKMIPNERYDPSGYLDLDVPEKASNASLVKWKREIYSVEQMARANCSENPVHQSKNSNQVGKREVKIIQKQLHDKPLEQRYEYAHDREITFVEEEPKH